MSNPYLLAAYVVFWLAPFALMLSMWLRQRRLERELASLREQLARREAQPDGMRQV